MSTRYGNDSWWVYIYIYIYKIYYIPPPLRTDWSSASIDYPHGGRVRLENRPGLNAGFTRGGWTGRGHIWRGIPDTEWIVAYIAARARIQRIILYATLKVIFNCHPAVLSTTMTSTIPHAKNRITAIYNNKLYIYQYLSHLLLWFIIIIRFIGKQTMKPYFWFLSVTCFNYLFKHKTRYSFLIFL